ncbi:hypothetical protein SAMN05444157_3045 [Frankineae bacterium MT45]|nr:hypothetical protein SAMN05444157_3045 [Frankineae bacterium MT45]
MTSNPPPPAPTSGHARIAGAVGLLRSVPGSIGLALGVLSVSLARFLLPAADHPDFARMITYRGRDLTHLRPGLLWRLPLSAFCAHSVADLLWTLSICATAFVLLERRLGTAGLLAVTVSAHVVSTVSVDLNAAANDWHSWLMVRDYGTSCLVMGAFGALLLATRSRWLLVGVLVIAAVDLRINSPMTISEHVIAFGTGAFVFAVQSLRLPSWLRTPIFAFERSGRAD